VYSGKKIQKSGIPGSVIYGKKIQKKSEKLVSGKPGSVIYGKKIQTIIMMTYP
jgi:hypothetical protein